jgi:hypothetical protein
MSGEAAPAEKKAGEDQTIIPYKWTQTLAEATLSIPVPEGTRARDVNCKITATHLTVGLKGQPPLIDVRLVRPQAPSPEPPPPLLRAPTHIIHLQITQGEVHKKIKPIESFWQMGTHFSPLLNGFFHF